MLGVMSTRTIRRACAGAASFWLVATAFAIAGSKDAQPGDPRPPDLFVYMIDTLRADEVGAYGASITKTPAIDALAERGVVFKQAYAVSSATRPSVASFLTGVHAPAHGAENLDTWLSPATHAFPVLPGLLRDAGYHTIAIVANPNASRELGFARGFDDFLTLHTRRKRTKRPSSEDLIADAHAVGARIIEKMKNAPRNKPLFLFALVIDPHAPYTPPPPYETLYDQRANGARHGSMRAVVTFDRELAAGKPVNGSKMRALYRGEITYVDHEFKKIIDWLAGEDRLERTMVVVTADHGEEFVDHGGRGHGKTLYEEVIRVPLIVRAPKVFPKAEKRGESVDLLDLSTTLLRTAGIDPPEHWVGRDLGKPIRARPILASLRDQKRDIFSLRQGRYKVIFDFKEKKARYFDLVDDPGETKALPLSPSDEMQARLLASLHEQRRAAFHLRGRLLEGSVSVDDTPDVDPELIEALESLGYTR